MKCLEFSYKPLKLEKELGRHEYVEYNERGLDKDLIKFWTINPLEDKLKDTNRDEFKFGDMKVTRTVDPRKSSFSAEGVYNSLIEFLKTRADDSREFDMTGLKFLEGVGYCILINDLKNTINKLTKENTSYKKSVSLAWPRAKKGEELPTKIVIPQVNYSKITTENLEIVQNAKKFCSGIDKNVINPFKEFIINWFEEQTRYSKHKLPSQEESPVKLLRDIEGGRYVGISLVRNEKPQYKEIIDNLTHELSDLENSVALEGYKTTKDNKGVYVNIKNVLDRLQETGLKKDEIKTEGSYIIVP